SSDFINHFSFSVIVKLTFSSSFTITAEDSPTWIVKAKRNVKANINIFFKRVHPDIFYFNILEGSFLIKTVFSK
ncbi:hypothetical protein DEM28_29920, partial [Enterobacter mori]